MLLYNLVKINKNDLHSLALKLFYLQDFFGDPWTMVFESLTLPNQKK